METEIDFSTKMKRAMRLRSCREATGLSVTSFARRNDIDIQWYGRLERGVTLLKDHMIHQITSSLKKEGLEVSKEWILGGIGSIPQKISTNKLRSLKNEEDIFKERKGAILIVVKNDKLAPLYERGDYVGGYQKKDIASCKNKNCILSLNRKTYIGKIISFNGMILTYNILGEELELIDFLNENEQILVAPIVFHKKFMLLDNSQNEEQEDFLENNKDYLFEFVS